MSVQNVISLAQKKDAELKIIEGLHNHEAGHKIHNISLNQKDKSTSPPGPCHDCNGLHFIKDCDKAICFRCKPNLNNHSPAKCPKKCHSNCPINNNLPHRHNTRNTHEANNYTESNLQLAVSTNKPDQMADLLEATRQMTQYFKKSIKHIPSHTKHNNHCQQISSMHHADRHKHRTHCHKDKVNDITSDTDNPQITPPETDKTIHDIVVDSSDNDIFCFRLQMTS